VLWGLIKLAAFFASLFGLKAFTPHPNLLPLREKGNIQGNSSSPSSPVDGED